MGFTIFLFRCTNLRLQDQISLKLALDLDQPIIFINCLNLKNEWNRKWINRSAWHNRRRIFRLQSLYDIDKRLISTDSKLFVSLLDPVKALDDLFSRKKGVFTNLVSNEEVGTYEVAEQNKIEKVCRKHGVKSHFVWDETMIDKDFYLKGTIDRRNGNSKVPVIKTKDVSVDPKQAELEKNSVLYERGKRRFHTNMPKVKSKIQDYTIIDDNSDNLKESQQYRLVSDPASMKLVNKSPLHKPIFFSRNLDDAMKDFYDQSNLGLVQCLDIVTPYINSFPFLNTFTSYKITTLPDFHSIQKIIKILTDRNEIENFYPPDSYLEFLHGKVDQGVSYENYSYPGGESAGFQRIFEHVWQTESLLTHKQTRNKSMGKHSSTKFSMWLANGNISGRQVLKEIAKFEREKTQNDGTQWVISEMLYRDYMRLGGVRSDYEMFTYGGFQRHPEKWSLFGNNTRGKRWDGSANKKYPVLNRPSDWEAWTTGNTGFPYVDASMRELINTGWMNWRGRGNVASFLVYNLGVDWRWGAEFFEHHLLDHDVSLNYVNWQNMAGIGWDDRDETHNVIKQSKQYEPDSDFIKFWCPELKDCPDEFIHTPWDWEGCKSFKNKRYANPIRSSDTFFYEKIDGSTNRDHKYDKSKKFESQGKEGQKSHIFLQCNFKRVLSVKITSDSLFFSFYTSSMRSRIHAGVTESSRQNVKNKRIDVAYR